MTPRSSEIAVNAYPWAWSSSSSAKIAVSAPLSITSVWSPPAPRPVRTSRSDVDGCVANISRSRSTDRRQTPSQSASSALSVIFLLKVWRILGGGGTRGYHPLDGRSVARRPERGAEGGCHAPGRPAARACGRGQRQDAGDHAQNRMAGRAGPRSGARAGPHLLDQGGRGDASAGRGAAHRVLRGAPLLDVPRLLRAALARGVAGGRFRPVLPPGHAGRPARDADGPRGRAVDPPSRPAGEPGAVLRPHARPHRPAEGRDGHARGVPALGRVAGRRRDRRRAGPERARARVRAPLPRSRRAARPR